MRQQGLRMADKSIMDLHTGDRVAGAERSTRPELGAIVYVSRAARPVAHSDLVRIREGARLRNAEENITGVLLCAHGSFMQYLEGPAVGLLKVYGIIKAHPLHYGLIDLMREPIQTREFAEWSMACHIVGAAGDPSLCEDYALLASRLGAALRPRSAACELLSTFWSGVFDSAALVSLDHGKVRSAYRLPADDGSDAPD